MSKPAFKKESTQSVTDALIKALESADRMKNVVVIYETVDDLPDVSHGVIMTGERTVAETNWLLDIAKDWLMNC